MSEQPKEQQPSADRPSAVLVRGINLPAHQVRAAINQAVVRGQVSEEDGEEIFWLYSYAVENKLNEAALSAKMGAYDKNTLYQLFRGLYGVYKDGRCSSWANVVRAIRSFKSVELEEQQKKHIGIVEVNAHGRCVSRLDRHGAVVAVDGERQVIARGHLSGPAARLLIGAGRARRNISRRYSLLACDCI